MKYSIFKSLAIFLMVCCSMSVVSAQEWTALGVAKVNSKVDHKEIWVTDAKGNFKAVKLYVKKAGVDFDHAVVHFVNGGHDMMDIKKLIPAGGETQVMEFQGDDRVIQKVEFFYKNNPDTRKKAKVVLYGRM